MKDRYVIFVPFRPGYVIWKGDIHLLQNKLLETT